MKYRLTLSFLFVFLLHQTVFAQDEYARDKDTKVNSSFFEKIRFGGGAGMQFGFQSMIEASPRIIYTATDHLFIGVGLRFLYYRINLDKIYGYGGISQSTIYGGSTFLNYLFFENIVAHAEYEALSFNYYDNLNQQYERRWISGLLAGGGYRQYFNNGRSFAEFLLLYNLTYNPPSPYSSPLVPRISIYF